MLQVVYCKTTHAVTINCSNCTIGYLCQGSESLCSHKHLYTDVHSIFILMSQSWNQPTCPSASEWFNRLYIQIIDYYSAIKKEQITDICETFNESPGNYVEWKKVHPKRLYMLYIIPFM